MADRRQCAMAVECSYKHSIVNGIVFPPDISQQQMDEVKDVRLRPDDVFIVTFPKSGTTWVQHIVKLLRNKGEDSKIRINVVIPWLEKAVGKVLESGARIDDLPSPRSFKSHTPYHMMPGGPPHTSPAKYIYIARNPKDVAVSLYYHSRAFLRFQYSGPWDHFFHLFINGKVESGSWFDHVLEWWAHKDLENVLFLKYEDMKRDLPGAVKAIAAFIGCADLKPEIIDKIAEQSTFDRMKDDPNSNYDWTGHVRHPTEPPFMRKGVTGDWRNHFTAEQNATFDALYAGKMEDTGLDFVFGNHD